MYALCLFSGGGGGGGGGVHAEGVEIAVCFLLLRTWALVAVTAAM